MGTSGSTPITSSTRPTLMMTTLALPIPSAIVIPVPLDKMSHFIWLCCQHEPSVQTFLESMHDPKIVNSKDFFRILWRVCFVKNNIIKCLQDDDCYINDWKFSASDSALKNWLIAYWCGENPSPFNLREVPNYLEAILHVERLVGQHAALRDLIGNNNPATDEWTTAMVAKEKSREEEKRRQEREMLLAKRTKVIEDMIAKSTA